MKHSRLLTILALLLLSMPLFGCVSVPVPNELERAGVEGEASEPSARSDDLLPAPRSLSEQPAVSLPPELRDELGEEPADGLTLEAAMERLLAANHDLAARFQDIPKARADVLTAGLRNDPVVFLSASPIAYNRYSPQRPGATTYDITVVQSIDVSGKHKSNKRVAQKQIPILEAHYQDAVRLTVDRLYTAYVTALEAQAAVGAARANWRRLSQAAEKSAEQVLQGRPSADRKRAALRRAAARLALRRAETMLLHARRDLAVLLAAPAAEADALRVAGSLHDGSPPPPGVEELIALARQARPDLRALRLSVDRAHAEVRREKAEALEDIMLFFSPYQATDSTPEGKQVAHSWELGVLVPIPAFNRNQGEIARARANVAQWRIEVARAEEEIVEEVRRAADEYTLSRRIVTHYEQNMLSNARLVREEKYRRFTEEEQDVRSFLSAQRDYDEILQAYLEALARHRRAMLRLNTAVGQRILP